MIFHMCTPSLVLVSPFVVPLCLIVLIFCFKNESSGKQLQECFYVLCLMESKSLNRNRSSVTVAPQDCCVYHSQCGNLQLCSMFPRTTIHGLSLIFSLCYLARQIFSTGQLISSSTLPILNITFTFV